MCVCVCAAYYAEYARPFDSPPIIIIFIFVSLILCLFKETKSSPLDIIIVIIIMNFMLISCQKI